MGLVVALYSTDVRTRNFYIIKSIQRALLRDSRIESVYILNVDNIVRECFSKKFDILLAIGGAGAIEEPLKRALQLARKSALWTTEDPYELTRNRAIGKNFDVVFTNDKHACGMDACRLFRKLQRSPAKPGVRGRDRRNYLDDWTFVREVSKAVRFRRDMRVTDHALMPWAYAQRISASQ